MKIIKNKKMTKSEVRQKIIDILIKHNIDKDDNFLFLLAECILKEIKYEELLQDSHDLMQSQFNENIKKIINTQKTKRF